MIAVGNLLIIRLYPYYENTKPDKHSDHLYLVTSFETDEDKTKFILVELESGLTPYYAFNSLEELSDKMKKHNIEIIKISKMSEYLSKI